MGAAFSQQAQLSESKRQQLLLSMPTADLRTLALQTDQYLQQIVIALQVRGEKVPEELKKRGYARLANSTNSVVSRPVVAASRPVVRRPEEYYPNDYSDYSTPGYDYNGADRYIGGKRKPARKSSSLKKKKSSK